MKIISVSEYSPIRETTSLLFQFCVSNGVIAVIQDNAGGIFVEEFGGRRVDDPAITGQLSSYFESPYFRTEERDFESVEKKEQGAGEALQKADGAKGPVSTALSAEHGFASNGHPEGEQAKLLHGVDPSKRTGSTQFEGANSVHFTSHPTHGDVLFKKTDNPEVVDGAHKEVAYHNLARDVFGLGHYVPLTAAGSHPVHGDFVVQKKVKGESFDASNPMHRAAIKQLGDSGELDKLHIMNHIMGNGDRHSGNFLMTPGEKHPIQLIDHDQAFDSTNLNSKYPPGYSERYNEVSKQRPGVLRHILPDKQPPPVHDNAYQWLMGLDHKHLQAKALENGASPETAKALGARLKASQAHFSQSATPSPRSPHGVLADGVSRDRAFTRHAQAVSGSFNAFDHPDDDNSNRWGIHSKSNKQG